MIRRFLPFLVVFLLGQGALLPSQSSTTVPPWSVQLSGGTLIPFGSAAEVVAPGAAIRVLAGYHPLPGPLAVAGSVGVARNTVTGADLLTTIDATAGLGVGFPVGPLRLGVYGLGGYGYSTLSGLSAGTASDGNVMVRGIGVVSVPAGRFEVALTGGYYRSVTLMEGIEAGLSVAYPRRAPASAPRERAPRERTPRERAPRTAPELPSTDEGFELPRVERSSRGMTVRTVQVDPVFPVFATFYETHGFGQIQVENDGRNTLENIVVSVHIDRVMDVPSVLACPSTLEPGQRVSVPLTVLFSSGILEITESTRMAMDVQVAFERRGNHEELALTDVVDVHDRNAVVWDDDRKVASFVTSRDPDVLRLSRQAAAVIRSRGSDAVNGELRAAIALFDTLRAVGLTYVVDPASPYAELSGSSVAVDYVQFPRQTIEYRAGDCDDLSILFAALAESIGMEAAFVTVPGHIYGAIKLQMTPAEARRAFGRPDDLIFVDEEVWLPVETTALEGTFLQAWQLGGRQWRENSGSGQAALIPIRGAWGEYPPVGLGGDARAAPADLSDRLPVVYEADLLEVVEREIYPQVARLRTRFEQTNDLRDLNRIAVVYARYGLYGRARDELADVVSRDARHVPALVNLGNIEYLDGALGTALEQYERDLTIQPRHAAALLGAARSHHGMENYGLVGRYFDALREEDPSLAERFAYLDFRGEEATRAADAAGIASVVVWDEGGTDE
jgi:tetratricopeptide (TPR) repeat protein